MQAKELMELLSKLFCRHQWRHHVVNIEAEGSCKCVVLAWRECPKCGRSELSFVYGS